MRLPRSNHDVQTMLTSLDHVYQLKGLPRSGWIQSGIPTGEVESVAAHSFGMSMLVLLLRAELLEMGIDVERTLSMVLIHDLAESIVGDITPHDLVPALTKHDTEKDAFHTILKDMRQAGYLHELWDEFEAGETREAKLAKRLDKLDMLIQAYFYEKRYEVRLDSFWENLDNFFKDSESEPIFNYIKLNRFEIEGSKT